MSPLVLYFIAFAIFLYLCFLNLRTSHRLPPGPKPWPLVGNLPHLGSKRHHSMAALAQKYGPLMHLRMGLVHVVVAASASVAAQFLKAHDANFSSRPPNSGAKYVAYNYQDLVFAPYEEVAVLTRALARASPTEAVNLGQLLNVCTTNTIGRVMLGRRVVGDGSGGGDQKAVYFQSMVRELMVLSGVFNIGDFVPALEWLDLQGVAAKMKKLHRRFDAFLTEIVEDHKTNGFNGAEKYMLSTLISLKEEGDSDGLKPTDTEIKALLLNMFTAGTDTSASTVEWAIAELIRHPRILAKVQQELDSVIGRERLVTESGLAQLTYLQALVKEAFRLHPATPLSLPRIAANSCEINGYHIPKNSTLLVNIWAIARDPTIWADPLKFKLERFLAGGENAGVDVKGNDFELIPFGAGRRICAGMSMALRMVHLLVGTLVHAFEWDLADGLKPADLNMEEAYGLTLQRSQPLMVHPKARLSSDAYRAQLLFIFCIFLT
ncbi:hypothetical protein P3X46_035180 [Hevea brasiliensis]|uniref:Flavonoid 3'-hydroxylase n=1 Tax=Hevea brasiliensis TaxID=3981 RepID=A0ABQ9KDT8_HEVBR|nr:hypothetical protein P3X46_035180 [Hevea brasiliensis]